MNTDPDDAQPLSYASAPAPDGGLPERDQRRNSLIYLLSHSLSYLVAPVFYVGILHAAIIHSLGSKDAIANLPEALYTAMLVMPVMIAWFWPSIRYLRPMLISSLLLKGVAGLFTAALFILAPGTWLVFALILHAAIIGATNGVTNMCLWELVGRGMTPARRGRTLGRTFGLGPIFAVAGSLASQLVLSGNFLNVIHVQPVPKPWSYVLLFAATGPAMIVSALAVFFVRLPNAADEPPASIAGVVRGLREYFMHPWILIAACGFLLTLAGGNMILPNLALFARDAIHEPAEKYSGLQLAIRFGAKSLVGFSLAWLLIRSNPKVAALATTLISLAGVCWALLVPGKWYLFSFALVGGGELFYIYYLNYIVSCSAPHRVRENTAYSNLIMVLLFFIPVVYGTMSDHFGLRSSFLLAGAILVEATMFVVVFLPKWPAPKILNAETPRPASGLVWTGVALLLLALLYAPALAPVLQSFHSLILELIVYGVAVPAGVLLLVIGVVLKARARITALLFLLFGLGHVLIVLSFFRVEYFSRGLHAASIGLGYLWGRTGIVLVIFAAGAGFIRKTISVLPSLFHTPR